MAASRFNWMLILLPLIISMQLSCSFFTTQEANKAYPLAASEAALSKTDTPIAYPVMTEILLPTRTPLPTETPPAGQTPVPTEVDLAGHPLWGTRRTLESLNGHALVQDTTITLEFIKYTGHPETTVTGIAGCNHYVLSRVLGDHQIAQPENSSHGEIITTQMLCTQKGIMEQEDEYLKTLAGVTTYQLVDARLETDSSSKNPVLVFRKGDKVQSSVTIFVII